MNAIRDKLLTRILLHCGLYYRSGNLFFQELWKERLVHLGFRVLSIEKFPYHEVWLFRLCGSLKIQTYLLISKPFTGKLECKDPLLKQLQGEIRQIAQELGPAIQRDSINVVRTGKYFSVSFIWPVGRPGRLLKQEKKPEAFSFLIKPWLKRNRN